jgi:alkyldihydroxyacetonephosphate synthase
MGSISLKPKEVRGETMRRWNGWGEEGVSYHLPESARQYLESKVGRGQTIPDASLDRALAGVPPSRLRPFAGISPDPADRLYHARGQSLADWVALRYGRIERFPDAVAYPSSDEEVRDLFAYSRAAGACLIPYGGGTSVVGHINPLASDGPSLTIDLSRLNRLIDLDATSNLATFEAGVCGPDLERRLKEHGRTLGHFPQSWELSTLGGWIATRSSGQQSYRYGRIEDLFAGGHVETPAGPIDLIPLPASAAGPDLRQMILGSEGRYGIITRAIVRVQHVPEKEDFHAIFFHDWASGAAAVREIAQAGIPVSMMRLSNAQETEVMLALSGRDQLVAWADRGLRLFKYGADRALLILGVTGDKALTRFARHEAAALSRKRGGLAVGTKIGHMWRKTRFLMPYLRNTLWEYGYALDTLETALSWNKIEVTAERMQEAIRNGLAAYNERALVFAHLSHVYADGASIYMTYLWRRSPDPEETLQQWRAIKHGASQAIIAGGGTISHQHGVGVDHAPYLKAEKGELGLGMIEAVRNQLDPGRVLNPGKLIE